jgi:hypothetical protein
MPALAAAHRLGRVQFPHPARARPAQHAAHGGRHADLLGDLPAAPAPAASSGPSRSTHFLTVPRLTPKPAATTPGGCLRSARRTSPARLAGVKRAFLWMFIRLSLGSGRLTISASQLGAG